MISIFMIKFQFGKKYKRVHYFALKDCENFIRKTREDVVRILYDINNSEETKDLEPELKEKRLIDELLTLEYIPISPYLITCRDKQNFVFADFTEESIFYVHPNTLLQV